MSASDPILSVIIPTKGRLGYLHRCLSALAAADYPPDRFEVVVVNDGGGHEVERIATTFRERFQVRMAAPERSGPSGARNAGAVVARGRYIAFTDDDCEPAPGWLPALERALDGNPGAAVGGKTRNGAPQSAAAASQIVVDAVHARFNRDPGSLRFFASNNLAFPTGPFLALGGFDERFRYAEDREMCDRWIGSGRRLAPAPGALVHHMRRLTLREFLGQHYGYGRGASAFHRSRPRGPRRALDRAGVLRILARQTIRRNGYGRRAGIVAYVALSQLATAAGVGRETLSRLIAAGRDHRSPHSAKAQSH